MQVAHEGGEAGGLRIVGKALCAAAMDNERRPVAEADLADADAGARCRPRRGADEC